MGVRTHDPARGADVVQGISDFASTNFSSNVDDLVLAADMLRDRYEAPALLVGHSLGGAAVLAAAARIPEAVGVVTIGAPFDPRQLTSLIPAEALSRLDGNGDVVVDIGGRPFPIRRQLLDDVNGRVRAAGSLDDPERRSMIDRIDVDLDGPLTDGQRRRLLDIAERCPVHRTLLGEKQ